MPFRLGPTELIVLLIVVLLVFGPGRISKIFGEIGSGIRNFRKGLGPRQEEDAVEQE